MYGIEKVSGISTWLSLAHAILSLKATPTLP